MRKDANLAAKEAHLREQQDRVLQQADKANGEEVDPVRERGGAGEESGLLVSTLQRRPRKEKSEILEGNSRLL